MLRDNPEKNRGIAIEEQRCSFAESKLDMWERRRDGQPRRYV
jgi:hypothetical protein